MASVRARCRPATNERLLACDRKTSLPNNIHTSYFSLSTLIVLCLSKPRTALYEQPQSERMESLYFVMVNFLSRVYPLAVCALHLHKRIRPCIFSLLLHPPSSFALALRPKK